MSQDLIKMLEAATEGHFTYDREIMVSVGVDAYPMIPATRSIDAAVALAERVLPEWNAHISTTGRAAIDRRNRHSRFEATAPTPALALCIAILKAKEASHDPR